jgi:hypothetical protein
MGLDCYIVHGNDRSKDFTAEDEPRIKDVSLCGGIMSGHGADGSFRGKWYEPLIDELLETDYLWHIEGENAHITAQQLKEQAEALADLLHSVESDAKHLEQTLEPETIVYKTDRMEAEYTYQEIQDLELLLRCASERGAVMVCWW